MAIVETSCHTCGATARRSIKAAELAAYPNAVRYCSRACRAAGATLTCERCGKAYYRKASAIKRRASRWCSKPCADAGRVSGESRRCARCGAGFYVYPSELSKPGRVNLYCSRACGNAASAPSRTGIVRSAETRALLSKLRRGVPNLKLRKPPIVHTCEVCNGPFEVSRRRGSAETARFCSTDCWYRYVRLHPHASGNYRGGKHFYYGSNWPSQAKKARERDDHTCQDCGLRQFNPRLDVHHLIPRREFANDHAAANQLDNLVSLCKACHIKREREMTSEMRSSP